MQAVSSGVGYCSSHQDSREHVHGGEDVGTWQLLFLCNVCNGPAPTKVLHECGKPGQFVDILCPWAAQDGLQLCRGQLCSQLCDWTVLAQVVLRCSTLTIMGGHQEHICVELKRGQYKF